MVLDMNSFVSVPVPVDLYAEFARRYPGAVASTLEHVAQDFLDRTEEDFAARGHKGHGMQWEGLPLPAGTEVRTKYFGEYKIAKVANEAITWQGKTYNSMSQLASSMRGDTSNNAWKVLEIKRPNDSRWQLADVVRRQRTAA